MGEKFNKIRQQWNSIDKRTRLSIGIDAAGCAIAGAVAGIGIASQHNVAASQAIACIEKIDQVGSTPPTWRVELK
jgi:hypothetical protein